MPARGRRARSAYASAIGETDGSIIAAVIVTHRPRYHARGPISIPGPASIPRIHSTVAAHATSEAARSVPTVRTAGITAPTLHESVRLALAQVALEEPAVPLLVAEDPDHHVLR